MREELERELAHKTYDEIDRALRGLSDGGLFDLFDSHSIKVGNSACDILASRMRSGFADLLVDALLQGRLRTKLGRMRASATLNQYGKDAPRAHEAYLHLLHDRSADVIDNALFGLVFLEDKANLPAIEAARDALSANSAQRPRFNCAIKALRDGNPFLFSSGFADSQNAWGLKDSPLKQLAQAAEDKARQGPSSGLPE